MLKWGNLEDASIYLKKELNENFEQGVLELPICVTDCYTDGSFG